MDTKKLRELKNIVDQGEKIEKHNKGLELFKDIMNRNGIKFNIHSYPTFYCHSDNKNEWTRIIEIDSDIILEHLGEMINKQIERNEKKFEEL